MRILSGVLSGILSLIATVGAADIQIGQKVVMQRGSAYAIDGDTIKWGGRNWRLHGVDAPERDQFHMCGDKMVETGYIAEGVLARLVSAQRLTCTVMDIDRYKRPVVQCVTARGQDIGREMVRRGYAHAYARYSKAYVMDQRAAMEEGAGLWRYGFDLLPGWEWRKP